MKKLVYLAIMVSMIAPLMHALINDQKAYAVDNPSIYAPDEYSTNSGSLYGITPIDPKCAVIVVENKYKDRADSTSLSGVKRKGRAEKDYEICKKRCAKKVKSLDKKGEIALEDTEGDEYELCVVNECYPVYYDEKGEGLKP